MSEEPIKPNPSPEQYAALQEELQKLKANNAKLLDQNIKAKEAGKAIPPDVDVNALIAYKQKKEQEELEVEAPAVSALADVVHDPQYVLSRINRDQLAREADGTVVIVDGYNRTPVKDWAQQKMPQWVQKNPRPQGGGATTTKVTADVITGEANPFAKESFNLTEQARLYRTDINKYNMLKNAVSG